MCILAWIEFPVPKCAGVGFSLSLGILLRLSVSHWYCLVFVIFRKYLPSTVKFLSMKVPRGSFFVIEARYVPALCDCRRLLEFLRYIVSADDAVLCANSVPRQSCQTRAGDLNDDLTIIGAKAEPTRLLCQMTNFQSSSTESPTWQDVMETEHTSDQSSFAPGFHPGCSGDSFGGAEVPTNAAMGSEYVTKRLSGTSVGGISLVGVGALNQVEPVGQTAAGLCASAGPDSCQLECARLIRTLAAEIVHAVDRYLLSSTSV